MATPAPPIDWAAAGKSFGAGVSTLEQENAPSSPIDWAAEGKKFGAGVTTVDQEKANAGAKPPSVIDWAAEGKKFGAGVSTVDQENAPGVPGAPLAPGLRGGAPPPAGGANYAPPVPPAPLPEDLKSDAQRLSEMPVHVNPKTGESFHEAPMGSLPVLDFPYRAYQAGKRGIEALAHPIAAGLQQSANVEAGLPSDPAYPGQFRDLARGAGQLGQSAMEAATPFAAETAIGAPAGMLATMAAGTAAQQGVSVAAKHLGIAPEYADLAGDLAAVLAGYAAAKIRIPGHVETALEVLQGKNPVNNAHTSKRISDLMEMAQNGGSLGERDIARTLLKRHFGIDGPPEAAAPSGAGASSAGAPPAPAAPTAEPEINYADPSTLGGAFAEKPPATTQTAEAPPNVAEYIKAHNAWNGATIKAAVEHMQQFGGTIEAAKAAVAGTVGAEPRIEDFQATPVAKAEAAQKAAEEAQSAAEEAAKQSQAEQEPTPPTPVDRVSADTPNPPTAAIPTQPESPETMALQLQQLGEGARRVVMFPKGEGMPDLETFPANVKLTHDKFGNTYAYRPDLIKGSAIHKAAENNTLTEVLGGPMGMGAPDKGALGGEPPITVVGRGPSPDGVTPGVEAQSTVTDAANLPVTHAATQAVTPAGGTVSIEHPADVIAGRGGVPPAVASEQAAGVASPSPEPPAPTTPVAVATTPVVPPESAPTPVAPTAQPKFQSQGYRQLISRAKAAGIDLKGMETKTIEGRAAALRIIQAKENSNAGRSASVNTPDLGAQNLGTNGSNTPDSTSGHLPDGNGPARVRSDSSDGGAAANVGRTEPNTGGQGDGLRRVTGSADIPVTDDGEKQAGQMAKEKGKKKFDLIVRAPNIRSEQTAGKFGASVASEPLDGWARGEYEGQPASVVSDEMKYLMLNPDVVPPGVSPVSGKPGMSWNQMAKPMFAAVRDVGNAIGKKQRILLVTSGGNLQAINAWAKAGFPEDFEFPHAEMANEPHWSVTGKMFALGPQGLEEVPDNKIPGRLYLIEHTETAFNPKKEVKATAKGKAKAGAKGTAALERRRDFFRPGNIVQRAGQVPERVLSPVEELADGSFSVRLQPLNEDLTPNPAERPRIHSAEPEKGDKIIYRAAVESERGAEARSGKKSQVLGPRRPSYPAWYGSPVTIFVPDENTRFEARYQVREQEDVVPSHNPITFDHNPDYQPENDRNYKDPENAERVVSHTERFEPGFLVTKSATAVDGAPIIDKNGNVLGGNNRAMAIARVYSGMNPGAADRYKAALVAQAAEFGLDPEKISAMRKPVLVRELARELDPGEVPAVVTDLNKTGTAALKPAERALADAYRVSPETLAYVANLLNSVGENATLAQALGDEAGQVILKLIDDGVVTLGEKPLLLHGNELTTAGKERVANLLIGRLFTSSGQLEAAPPELKQKLLRMVAPLSRITDPAWNLMPDVRAAVSMLDDAHTRGIKDLGDLVLQGGLFGDDTKYPQKVIALAKFIQKTGQLKLAKAFSEYATDSGGSLFHSLTPDEAFIEAFQGEDEAVAPPPPAAAGETPGVYMGMGLGAMQPYLDAAGRAVAQYTREQVMPQVEKILGGAGQIWKGAVEMFAPRKGVPTPILDQIYRLRGGREAAEYLVARKLDKWAEDFHKMSQQQMIDFIDRQKTGRPQATPHLQELGDFLRRVDDGLYHRMLQYHPTLEYLADHYRVLWKVIPGSPQAIARMQRRGFRGVMRNPLQGTKGMLKQHTLADMSEGLRMGGVPYSYNPIRMFQAHFADSMKYLTAQDLWKDWKRDGVRKFVKKLGDVPPGYAKLDDAIAKVYFPADAGLVDAGDWYVQEGAARLLNNMLGRDYLRNVYEDAPLSKISGNLGSSLLAIKNATTAVELGPSFFHAVFEANEANGGQIGLALREMWNLGVKKGDPVRVAKGAMHLLTAPAAFVNLARLGRNAKKAFGDIEEFKKSPMGRKWLADHPTAREGVEQFFLGGGKMGMPEDFKLKAAESFKEYWRSARAGGNNGHYIAAAIKSPAAFFQAIMNPLFEDYIPDLKLAMFLKEFSQGKEEMASRLQSGEMTTLQLSRNIVDSVENRFGEMNFDNLFWNRTFKTAAQLALRSVTWKFGSLRLYSSAIKGQLQEFQRGAKNKELPTLDMNMGAVLGMTIWTAILGTVITFAATRKRPKEAKDFVYPVSDSSTGMRLSIPTYWRDILHLRHDPLGYGTSSMAGDIGKVIEAWENRDFYGNSVYNEDDPEWRKAMATFLHLIPVPFSWSSYQQSKQEGGNALTKSAGLFGFTKAPKYIEQTKAQQLASELFYKNHRVTGSRTASQAERAKTQSGIRNIYRRGGDPSKEIADAQAKRIIDPRDVAQDRKDATGSELRRTVKQLSLTESLRVYDAANDEERKDIDREVRDKIFTTSQRHPRDFGSENSLVRQLAKKYFPKAYVPLPSALSPMSTPMPIE